MKNSLIYLIRLSLITIILIVLLFAAFVMIYENKFIFFPDKYPVGYYAEAENIPGLIDCWMTTDDGIKLHGWFLPADSAIATLVMSHGNAGNISNRIVTMATLRRYGFNVFIFDYRGFGKSEGSPSEEGIYIDGRTAFDYVAKLPQVDPKKIVLWGSSLGGAVAVDVAMKRQAAGLILESTFTSVADMAAVQYPFVPVRYFLRTELNSKEKIAQIHTPLLVMHGNNDHIIPIRLGRELYAAANDPKEFYEIVGADHNDTHIIGGAEYSRHIREFILKFVSQKH